MRMGIDIMKSNGTRCPPVLIAGLVIMCLYLSCSWWSVSSQSSELLKQLDNLAQQLRLNGDELEKCSQERIILDEKLKDSQNKFVQQQIKIEQVKESEDEVKDSYQKVEMALQESKKKSESAEKNLGMCQAELESLKKLSESKDKTTETLRTENESLKSELRDKEKQIKQLEQQIKAVNKTGDLLAKNKFIQSLVRNNNANMKKNSLNIIDNKPEKENNNKGLGDQQNEEKFEGEGKIYGDSGLLSVDNDPREMEMKDS